MPSHLGRAAGTARNAYTLLVTALVFALLAGCDLTLLPGPSNPAPTPVPVAPTPTRPAKVGSATLTIRLKSDVVSLNPWVAGLDAESQKVTGLIFDGLTKIDNHLQPQPDLAERWDVTDDGTRLTFHLRKDARWHDGKPFGADDVVWSYNALLRLPASTPAMLHVQDTVQSVEAVEPVSYTVRFNLKSRYSPLLADLSTPVLPKHLLASANLSALAANAFNNAPVGTGPFAFEGRKTGQSVELKANPDYYGGEPLIRRVGFVVAPDDLIAEEAVKDGTLTLAELPPSAAERVVKQGGAVRGGAFDETGYDFVAFNLREPHPFSDTRLRKAWALAIDKPGLVFGATGGDGDPVWTDVPSVSWAYNPKAPRSGGNPDEARSLLASAGWTDTNADGIVDKGGKPLQINLYVRQGDKARLKAADLMAAELAKVGIGVKVEAADFQTALLARIGPMANPPFDFDAVLLGWTRLGVDPDPYALFHSSQVPTQADPSRLNFTGFYAPEYDSLVIDGRSTYDFGKRAQIYARTQEIIADQLPYYFLWSNKTGVVARSTLKGEIDFASPRYLWSIERWYMEGD